MGNPLLACASLATPELLRALAAAPPPGSAGATTLRSPLTPAHLDPPPHRSGWAFDAEGRLQDVPSAEPGRWPKRPLVSSYPVVEDGGFVWLFFGDLPEDLRPPIPTAFVPELNDANWHAGAPPRGAGGTLGGCLQHRAPPPFVLPCTVPCAIARHAPTHPRCLPPGSLSLGSVRRDRV